MNLSSYGRLIGFFLAGAVLQSGAWAQSADYSHEGPILIRNVAVIDGLGHHPQPMRDVLIADGRIARMSVTGMIGDLLPDTHVIDGERMTVLPGLIDLHVHLGNISFSRDQSQRRNPEGVQKSLNAHLYAGVTTVLDLGNDHDYIVGLRDAVASGERMGPRIVATGRNIGYLETASGAFSLISPETQAEIKERLDKKEAAGISTIKLYVGMSNWGARHVMNEAKKRGMVGIADFWCTNLSRTTFEVTQIDGYAHGGCRASTQEEGEWMAANDKFAILTLSIFDIMGGHRPYEDYKTKAFLKDPLVVDALGKDTINDYYAAFPTIRQMTYDSETAFYQVQLFGDMKNLLAYNQQNAMTFYEAGVLMGMGTDAPSPAANWPGEAMHRELELHVEAGIPPVQAIKMATHNGARILRQDHAFGSIETGKIADLIIVRGDPSTNISDTRNVEYVIKGGKLVDRQALRYR